MATEKVIKIIVDTGDSKKKVQAVGKSVDKLGESAKKTSKTTKSFSGGLNSAFSVLPSSIQGAINSLRAFRVALISTGVGAIVVALGGLVALFLSANKKGAEFGKALSGLKAITGSTNKELKTLSKQAKQLGSSTAFTANEVVKLQTELAKLGFTIKDIENSTPAILDLAASLDVDLANAAMALSTSKSALSFDSLQESIKIIAPTSKAMGVSLEKTTALLGVLADRGLKGSIAGTGLGKTFIELNKKGITLDGAFEKVNKSSR